MTAGSGGSTISFPFLLLSTSLCCCHTRSHGLPSSFVAFLTTLCRAVCCFACFLLSHTAVHAELGRLGSLCPRQIVTHVVQGMYGASSYAFEWLKPWPAWATLLVVFAPSPFALRSVLGGDVGVEHLRVLALSPADAKKKWTAEAVAEAAVPLCEYFDDAERHSIAARARTMHPRCVVGTPTAPLARHAAALSRLAACMDVGRLGTCLKVGDGKLDGVV